MDGTEAVRRIQRMWRRHVSSVDGRRIFSDDDERDERITHSAAAVAAVVAATSENGGSHASPSAVADGRRRRHHRVASGGGSSNSVAALEQNGSTAAMRIQQAWRRWRQAIRDHEEDWASDGSGDKASVAGSCGATAAASGGGAPAASGSGGLTARELAQLELARSAAVVEQCWRDLQDECESLATTMGNNTNNTDARSGAAHAERRSAGAAATAPGNDAVDDVAVLRDLDPFFDEDGEGLLVDGGDAAAAIQRWWRLRSMRRGETSRPHDGDEDGAAAAALHSAPLASSDDAAARGDALNDAGESASGLRTRAGGNEDDETPLTTEDAVRALQRRFRWWRLREAFLASPFVSAARARVHERDRNEAAETVQRVWRVRAARQRHRREMQSGMRNNAARVIQSAFRSYCRSGGGSAAGNASAPATVPAASSSGQQDAAPAACAAAPAPPTPTASAAPRTQLPQCSVCLSEDVAVVLLPCAHACLCVSCGDAGFRRCPICRALCAMRIRIYL